jgi:hypothetical protein
MAQAIVAGYRCRDFADRANNLLKSGSPPPGVVSQNIASLIDKDCPLFAFIIQHYHAAISGRVQMP